MENKPDLSTADKIQFIRSQKTEVLMIQLISEVSIRNQCSFDEALSRIVSDLKRNLADEQRQWLLLGSLPKPVVSK